MSLILCREGASFSGFFQEILFLFSFLQLNVVFLGIGFLVFILFGILRTPQMCGFVFVINFGKTSVIITLCISSVSLFLSPPSSVATTQMLHTPFVIQKGAIPSQREKTIVLGYSPVFFVLFLFFLCISVESFMDNFSSSRYFFLSHVQSTGAPIKDFLHFCFLFPVLVFDSS